MFDLTQFYLFELVVMRITGFVALTPLLGRNNVPGIVKAGFTLVLSYFVMGIVGEGPEAPQSTTALILTLLLELGVGLVIGFLMRITFSVVQTGGEIIDAQIVNETCKAMQLIFTGTDVTEAMQTVQDLQDMINMSNN